MSGEVKGYTLGELSEQTGVSARTVRYYVANGLLPAPDRSGPAAHYPPGALSRLRLIRKLQDEHLPLAEIRARLERLADADVAGLLEEPSALASAPPASSAADYIRRVLGQRSGSPPAPQAVQPPASPRRPSGSAKAGPPERSQWERIALTPDIELHLRRPLSRPDNRRVERLLEAARQLFDEENEP